MIHLAITSHRGHCIFQFIVASILLVGGICAQTLPAPPTPGGPAATIPKVLGGGDSLPWPGAIRIPSPPRDDVGAFLKSGPKVTWSPVDESAGRLYPGVELARYAQGAGTPASVLGPTWLGDFPNSPYGFRVKAQPGVRIKVVIRCDEFMKPSEHTVQIEKDEVYSISPRVRWKLEALRNCTTVHPVKVTWEVWANEIPAESHTASITVQPFNVLPLVYTNTAGAEISTYPYLAAYANEDHPLLGAILKEALATKIVGAFNGMPPQSDPGMPEDLDHVRRQVGAIWWALQQRGTAYRDLPRLANADKQITLSPPVRLFDEVITARQGNSLEGSLLFASLLRRIGIPVAVLVTEDHAVLAYRSSSTTTAYLDVTRLNHRKGYLEAVEALQKDLTGKLPVGSQPAPRDPGPETQTCPADAPLALKTLDLALTAGEEKFSSDWKKHEEKKSFLGSINFSELRHRLPPIPSSVAP